MGNDNNMSGEEVIKKCHTEQTGIRDVHSMRAKIALHRFPLSCLSTHPCLDVVVYASSLSLFACIVSSSPLLLSHAVLFTSPLFLSHLLASSFCSSSGSDLICADNTSPVISHVAF